MAILIGYDGSSDAQAAIEGAARLMPGAEAVVLTVYEPFEDVIARSAAGFDLAPVGVDFVEIDRQYERNASARAAEGAERAGAAGLRARPRTHKRQASIAAAILTEAAELEADAIVLGTRGLSGLKSALLGSVSHAVLQHADRPVIVVPSPQLAERRGHRRPASDVH